MVLLFEMSVEVFCLEVGVPANTQLFKFCSLSEFGLKLPKQL